MATLRSASEAHSDTLARASTIAEPLRPRAENAYTVEPGTLLAGKYRVVRTLGRGGMGVVVEAFHLELEVPVAIKVLLPDFMAYAEAATRFSREARAVTRLTSQHVARVIDVDALPSGEPFIVMEYLKGQDLADRGRETIPLSVGEAVDYFVQACDAIADAHANGVVHRDIKPANVFLARRPNGEITVKVLDFGVSKVLTGSTSEVSLTQTTTILGSALYMSPEQMRSAKNVDGRTDIYALGACLYEMLARRPPYVASSFPELCAMVYSGPPMSITEWSPDVPDGLAKVIEKSLAHEPDARYATVAELVQALAPFAPEGTRARIEAILKQHAPHLEMPPPARKRRSLDPVFESDTTEAAPARSKRWIAWALVAAALAGGLFAFRKELPLAFFHGLAAPVPVTEAAQPAGLGTAPPAISAQASATATASATTPDVATATASEAPIATPIASATTSASASTPASSITAIAPSPAPSTRPAATATAAPSTSASASATSSSQAAAPSTAATSAPTTAAPPPRETAAPPDPTPAPAPTPAPTPAAQPGPSPIHGDLTIQTCYEIQADGSRKTVPCP